MPLSEVPQMVTRGNHESTQSRMPNCSPDLAPFMPDQGFVELLWENGQIVMQGQSNRPNKRSFTNTFTSHTAKFQEKDGRDAVMPKAGQFGTADSVFNDLSHSVPSAHIGLNTQDDDMVPWLSYPIEDPLQNDYCSEFLNEFPGFNQNSLSNNNNSVPAEQSSNLEDGHGSRSLAGGSDPSRIRTSQLFQLSQQSQSPATATNSRSTELCIAKQDAGTSNPVNPSSNMGFMNFPHFSRPIARAKSNLQGTDKLKCHEKGSTTASSKPVESTVINTASGLKSPSVIQGQSSTVPFNEESKETAKTSNRLLNHVTHHSSTVGTSVALGRQEVEKGTEAVVASSSVCSANSAGPESNDCKYTNKRKCLEGEDSGYQSEDVEDESVGLKKPASGRGASAKRTRAAEVHNLSERRRRDRINEKMRALQELIPNCNKVDKASMLDEAIEYLKTLQLQVQIMSMGSGLCMPPMMLPAGMQHLRPHPMTHFAPMGVNMGFGYGMGMVDMHRSPFACPSMPPGPGLPGSTGLQMFGIPGQGLHVPMPQPPPFASSLSSHSAQGVTTTSPLPVTDVTPSSDSKNQEQRNLSLEINTSTRELQNQTSNQSPVVQMSNQTSHASQN